MDISSSRITGISSIVDSGDAVNKSYVDAKSVPNITGQEGQFLSYSTKNPESIVTDGLVLYLDAGNTSSYSGTGDTWTDLSGSGNNITLVNGPIYSSSDGGFIVFDGTNDYGVKTTHSVTPNGGMTIDVWINMNSVDFAASEAAFLNHSGFGYLNLNFTNSTNKFRLEYKSVSASNTQLLSSTTVSANTWYNFVSVVDNNGGAKIYINGVLDNSNGINANLTSTINSDLYIGYNSSQYFPNAKFAIVKEYNRPLSQLEIEQNFNAEAYRFLSGYEEPFVPTVSWEPLTNYSEYTTAGSYTFDVPSYAKEVLIEATGAGGAGASGNTDGDSYSINSNAWANRNVTGSNHTFGTMLYDGSNYLLGERVFRAIYVSTDSYSWSLRAGSQRTRYYSSAYAGDKNEKYIFTGGNNSVGSIVTSTNNIVWVLRTSAFSANVFNSVIYGDGVYIVSSNGDEQSNTVNTATSTDAIHWTLRTALGGYNDLVYAPNRPEEKYVGVSQSAIAVTTDGIVWRLRTDSGLFIDDPRISYANNLFFVSGSTGRITSSTDTVVWELRTSGISFSGSGYAIRGISYGDGIYLFNTLGGLDTLRYAITGVSTDTIVWTLRSVFTTARGGVVPYFYGNYYANNNFFVYGGGQAILIASPTIAPGFSGGSGGSGAYASWQISKDQIAGSTLSVTVGQGGTGGKMIEPTTWTQRTSGITANIFASTYGNGFYLIAPDNSNIRSSTNGIVWITRTSGISQYRSMNYFNDLYFAAGDSVITTSTDTIVWTRRTSGFGATGIWSLTYGNNLYVAAGQNGTLATSTDSIVWTQRTSGFGTSLIYSLTFGNNLYVAGGDIGTITTSTDGIVWTYRTASIPNTVYGIIYVNNNYVSVRGTGNIITSTDTIVWTQRTSSVGSILTSILYNNLYVAASANGEILTSTDSIIWTQRTSGFGATGIWSLTYGNNVFVAGGIGGTLTTSTNLQAPTSATASSVSWTGPGSLTYTVSASPGGSASLPYVYPAGGTAGSAETGTDNYLQSSPGIDGADGGFTSGPIPSPSDASASFQPTSGGTGAYGNTNAYGSNAGTMYYYNNTATTSSIEINGDTGILLPGLSYGGGGTGGGVQVDPAFFWTRRTSVHGGSEIYDIIHANNLYVASGNGGKLTTSTDTIVWELRTSGFGGSTIYALIYGNNLYVAGGSGTLTTSTDSIVWTYRTSGFGGSIIYDFYYGNNLYVAGGSGGTLTTSTDTIVWTRRTSGFGSTRINSITYGNGLYVAGGTFTEATLATSTDTIVWELRTSGFGISTIYSLTYANNLYIAGGGTFATIGILTTSTDGIVWTYRTSGFGTTQINFVNYVNNLFFAGSNAGGTLASSTDTIVWTKRSSVGFSNQTIANIAYAGNNIYIIGGGNGIISSSYGQIAGRGGDGSRGGGGGGGGYLNIPEAVQEKGSLWNLRTSGTTSSLNALTYSPSYVLAGGASGTIRVSTDSIMWVARTSGITVEIESLTYGNNLYVGVTSFNGQVISSTDTIVWTQRTSGRNSQANRLVYGNNFYVISGVGVHASTDSIVWEIRTDGFSGSASFGLAYGNNFYIIAGQSGKLSVSTDTIIWTQRTSGFGSTNISSLTYGNNLYVSGGISGTLTTSTDTIIWEQRTSGFGTTIISTLTYVNNLYVASGTGGTISTSTDGNTWSLRTSNTTQQLNDSTSVDNLLVVSGNSGTITTSSALDILSPEFELAGDGGNGGDGYVKLTWW